MKRLLITFSVLLGLLSFAQAGSMTLMGAGKPTTAAPPSYTGPGDVLASAQGWFSCSRAYSLTFATTAGSICDLVAVTGGAAVCTLKIATNGFADQSAYCPGSLTPAAACAAASGGACAITKVYDQTGNGNHMLQSTATLAQLPTISFSSTPTGSLPAINCGTAGAVVFMIATTSTGSATAPWTFSSVLFRTSGNYAALGATSTIGIGGGSAANQLAAYAGTEQDVAATDSTWHAFSTLFNGASSVLNLDGTDGGSVNTGTNSIGANSWRLCRAAGGQYSGLLAEGGIWFATSTSGNRSALSANQHGTSGYNF